MHKNCIFINLIVRNDKPYAFETWGKGSFCKIMVITWVFAEILSRDVVSSADFTTVDCKKGLQNLFCPPSLLDQHLKFVLKSTKLHSFPILGHFGMQNSEKMHTFLVNMGVYVQK